MDLAQIIREETEAGIKKRCLETLKKPAFIPFFLNHEHRKVFERNMRHQIFGAELRWGVKMDIGRVKRLIQGGVDVLMHGCLETAKLSHMSAAERKRLEDHNGKEKAAAEWYAEEQKILNSTAISASMHNPNAKTEVQGTEEPNPA